MTIPEQAPIVTHRLDGHGGGSLVDMHETDGVIWRHLHIGAPESVAWLETTSKLDPEIVAALLAPETRPRCVIHKTLRGDGVFINLRGVNLNEGAAPEDMISIRIWMEPDRIVSVWRRPMQAIEDIMDAIKRGQAPLAPCDFVAKLAVRLADRAEPVVATMNETIDSLEEAILAPETPTGLRGDLADIRRQAIVLRRFMFPQRDALSTLAIEDLSWLSERERLRLREATDRITRLGEELDAIRERAAIVHEQIVERRSEAMNRNMLILAIVAAIFLPLGLLTGLLGVNVGGIPGAETRWAFWGVCGILGLTALFQLWLFRRLRLI